MEKFKTLEIVQRNPNSPVFNVYLNRPSVLNALSRDFFTEFPKALSSLDQNPKVGVVVLSGNGDHFCSGIDISTLASITENDQSADRGRTGERLRREIKGLQEAIMAIERCRKPVIAGVHGACIGGGVDIITACDIRFCTEDAFFSVKEVDLGLTADLGSLQRLPSIVGYGNAMELALTARRFSGSEAKQLGLVSRVFASKAAMEEGVRALAEGKFIEFPNATVEIQLLINGRMSVVITLIHVVMYPEQYSLSIKGNQIQIDLFERFLKVDCINQDLFKLQTPVNLYVWLNFSLPSVITDLG